MEYPPSKRLRGLQTAAPVEQDPFGDDEDFTQDDLEEIDIIASQAITGEGQFTGTKRTFGAISSYPGEQSKAPVREGRRTFTIGSSSSSSSTSKGHNSVERQRHDSFGNGQVAKDRDELYYSRLEAQQAELKKKLKEVEDQILMKNGEIRVLRDSLKLANQEKEQQRQANVALERESTRVQSEKEKELSKKVESLQSELHFKEAEMNEMRSKLQNSERGARLVGTPVRNNTNSPGARAFMTKETFSAELSVKASSSGLHPDGGKQSQDKCEKEAADSGFYHKEPVLLNLLLQHPLEPSSLGLHHLLCISPEVLPGLSSHSSYTSPASSAGSSTSSTDPRFLHRPQAHFYQFQSLAMSGLGLLAQRRPILPGTCTRLPPRICPAAVHLLPLLNYHIGLFCQTLESIDRSGKSPLRGGRSLSGSSDSCLPSTVEESLAAREEFALAALKALYHALSESSEAVLAVLSGQESERPSKACDVGLLGEPQLSSGFESTVKKVNEVLQAHHHLLQKIVQLVDQKFVSSAGQREAVVNSSLRILCVLAERAEESQLWRLKVVLSSEALAQNLSLESAYATVHLSVRFLALMVDCDEIATQLCSHNFICPLARVFQYITSRPDKSVAEEMWSRLETEAVQLLAKLFAQKTSTWPALLGESSCQCSSEVVRTVVVVLHRQWLSIKGQEKHAAGGQMWTSPGVRLLREALVLLHWLLLNDSSFSMHCLDVLHIYHQVIPAIRDTLRKIPDLSESEELAIEEICRPEADVEDMDIDAGS